MKKDAEFIRVLDQGSVEERAKDVLQAIVHGLHLIQGGPYGAYLLAPDDQICVVPRDVMEHLQEQGYIELTPNH